MSVTSTTSVLDRVDHSRVLGAAYEQACAFLDDLDRRPVPAGTDLADTAALVEALGGSLAEQGEDPVTLIQQMGKLAETGVVASRGPRFGGYVVGGCHPVAQAADMLVSTWDQFAATHAASPLVSVAEHVALRWLIDLLGLQTGGRDIEGGFVTGTSEAHIVALATARHRLYARVGWDVEERGLYGAPPLKVFLSSAAHVSVEAAVRYLGLGLGAIHRVPVNWNNRMLPGELERALRSHSGPAIVVAGAGEINTGVCDPFGPISDVSRDMGAHLHIDGAFGLLARLSPRLAPLLDGVEAADSWALDMHKMGQVPYDCGVVLTAHPQAHRDAVSTRAPYTTLGPAMSSLLNRDGMDYSLGMARRARGFPWYLLARALGRDGLSEIIDRCHDNAVYLAELLQRRGIRIPFPVGLNQVLIDVAPRDASIQGAADFVQATIDEILADGTTWLGGTVFRNRAMLRYSMANYLTTRDDVEMIAHAVSEAAKRVRLKGSL